MSSYLRVILCKRRSIFSLYHLHLVHMALFTPSRGMFPHGSDAPHCQWSLISLLLHPHHYQQNEKGKERRTYIAHCRHNPIVIRIPIIGHYAPLSEALSQPSQLSQKHVVVSRYLLSAVEKMD